MVERLKVHGAQLTARAGTEVLADLATSEGVIGCALEAKNAMALGLQLLAAGMSDENGKLATYFAPTDWMVKRDTDGQVAIVLDLKGEKLAFAIEPRFARPLAEAFAAIADGVPFPPGHRTN